jgi:hypothetical protein
LKSRALTPTSFDSDNSTQTDKIILPWTQPRRRPGHRSQTRLHRRWVQYRYSILTSVSSILTLASSKNGMFRFEITYPSRVRLTKCSSGNALRRHSLCRRALVLSCKY